MVVSPEIKAKAEMLLNKGNVSKELETGRRIHFRVIGETEEHSVIYDKDKDRWSCDCQYFALKQNPCSHIVACQISRQ